MIVVTECVKQELTSLPVLFREAAKELGSTRVCCPKAVAKALRKLKATGKATDALQRAEELAGTVHYERRGYGPGVTYSWPFWREEPLKTLKLKEPWPAVRWPKAVLVYEILVSASKGEVRF
jgi:hypothetical protein